MDNYINTSKFNKILLNKYYIMKQNPKNNHLKTLLTYYLSLGCEKYPNIDEFSYFLQKNYGLYYEVVPYPVGSYDIIRFSLYGVNPKLINDDKYTYDFLENTFNEVIKPVIKNNTFSNEKLNNSKSMCVSDIYYAYEDFDSIATNNTINYYFKNTKNDYPRICNIDDINKITADELYSYYQKIIKEYNVSYFIGDIENNSITKYKKLDSHLFTDRGKCSPKIIEKKNTNQAYLRIVYDGKIFSNDDLYYPALFITEKFGGGISSDLFNEIREKLGLCYSINSAYYSASGILLVSAVINKKDLDLIVEKIDEVYNKLLDDLDLEFLKKQFMYDKLEEQDNINTYAANSFYDTHFPYIIPSSDELDKINNVTLDDIKLAHKKIKRSLIYLLGGDLDE